MTADYLKFLSDIYDQTSRI